MNHTPRSSPLPPPGVPSPKRSARRTAWTLTTLIFLGLWGWALSPTEPVVREKLLIHIEPIGEILSDQSAGQTFLAPYNGLYRIEVLLADYGRVNSGMVNFRLSLTPGDTAASLLKRFSAAAVRGDVWYTFEFDPIPDSANKLYYFQLDAPEANLGRALTAYISPQDAYPDGAAYRAGHPVSGDLIFAAHFKEEDNLWNAATFWLARLKAYKPSLLGRTRLYAGLLAGYLTLVVVLIRQLAKPTDTGEAS